jgi:AhpD family alkylhydroperoxidase
MATNYPEHREHIQGLVGRLSKDIPDTMAAFGQLHHAAAAQGALSPKEKELIALGIAIALRCDGCIAYHVHDAINAGATREEMIETIGVAILMGGGPSLMYGAETYEAIEQFMGRNA